MGEMQKGGSNNIRELRERVDKILDVCVKHNVKLKFVKIHLGHKTAKFFGYELHEHGYRLDDTRKQALQDIPLPGWGKNRRENQKQMKSFLGFSVYFHNFVENYAALAVSH